LLQQPVELFVRNFLEGRRASIFGDPLLRLGKELDHLDTSGDHYLEA